MKYSSSGGAPTQGRVERASAPERSPEKLSDCAMVRQALEDLEKGPPEEVLEAAKWFRGLEDYQDPGYLLSWPRVASRLGLRAARAARVLRGLSLRSRLVLAEEGLLPGAGKLETGPPKD